MKMDAVVKTKWLEDLRSGSIKQAIGALRVGDAFCCLGVLCDIHASETSNEWDFEAYVKNIGILPNQVMKWAGLNSVDPIVCGAGLSAWNDAGCTFEEIASAIEEHL